MQACRRPVCSLVPECACLPPAATASPAQTEEEVANAVVEADLFALASHQYWGVWALVQVRVAVCHPLPNLQTYQKRRPGINQAQHTRRLLVLPSCRQNLGFMWTQSEALDIFILCIAIKEVRRKTTLAPRCGLGDPPEMLSAGAGPVLAHKVRLLCLQPAALG
jgi:hypothetical protein